MISVFYFITFMEKLIVTFRINFISLVETSTGRRSAQKGILLKYPV